ncbi:MAG TPA: ADP-ribosylglycohydrolase [Chloroflexi bacterium]|nr:ADP-ribosylglycohydrolase [Chloroflexota bacterium]
MQQKYLGCLLGLACGDAVGTTVEFKAPGTFPPVTEMLGGGPFQLKAGQWTDDTSMALCLAESLLGQGRFDARDQMERYVRWWQEGYLSSTGTCFDIGNTIQAALQRYIQTGEPFSGSAGPRTAGNGSIMRLAPVPMFYQADLQLVIHYSAESSKTTHRAQEAVDACKLFGLMIALALGGSSKEEILMGTSTYLEPESLAPKIREIQAGGYHAKTESQIEGSGYVVKSLEAALWCFSLTSTYQEAVLKAVNLGRDADTTAAVVGQLAGAYYGLEALPEAWLEKLAMAEQIRSCAGKLYQQRA